MVYLYSQSVCLLCLCRLDIQLSVHFILSFSSLSFYVILVFPPVAFRPVRRWDVRSKECTRFIRDDNESDCKRQENRVTMMKAMEEETRTECRKSALQFVHVLCECVFASNAKKKPFNYSIVSKPMHFAMEKTVFLFFVSVEYLFISRCKINCFCVALQLLTNRRCDRVQFSSFQFSIFLFTRFLLTHGNGRIKTEQNECKAIAWNVLSWLSVDRHEATKKKKTSTKTNKIFLRSPANRIYGGDSTFVWARKHLRLLSTSAATVSRSKENSATRKYIMCRRLFLSRIRSFLIVYNRLTLKFASASYVFKSISCSRCRCCCCCRF